MFAKTKLYKNLLPYWLSIVGFILVGIIIFIIWDKLSQINFNNFSFSDVNLFPIIFAFLLMPLNWFLESIKWGKLLDNIQKLSLSEKFKSVFFGQAFGFVTPNRLGDYGGRLMYILKENRIKALQSTFVASLYQTTITFCIGIPAFIFWLSKNAFFYHKIDELIWMPTLILFVVLLLFTFQLKRVVKFILRFKFFHPYANEINWFLLLPKSLLTKTFLLSLLRYIVFLIQYILVVYSFDPIFSWMDIISIIASIYLLTTIIPTGFISDLIVRGASGILLFLPIIDSEETILLISFIIWFINIAMAAIIGSLLFLKRKKHKS